MLIHHEIRVRAKGGKSDSRDLIQVFSDFCERCSHKYTYLRDKSLDYQQGISADACIIHRHDLFPHPILSFASNDGASMRLTNIVPRDVSEIDIPTYNSFALDFFTEFRHAKLKGIHITCTSDDCKLSDVIPGAKTRSFFERYLNQYPTSYHPLDIERLDIFICAAQRYSGGKVDTYRLRRYLSEVLSWSPRDTEWCCSRIDAGLDILRIDRRF